MKKKDKKELQTKIKNAVSKVLVKNGLPANDTLSKHVKEFTKEITKKFSKNIKKQKKKFANEVKGVESTIENDTKDSLN